MAAQFQYLRLAHQAQAVEAIAEVFADVQFVAPVGAQANPVFLPAQAHKILKTNIERIRAAQRISAGAVQVASTATPALSLDVLMETGTGKTFTFIETIHKLHQQHRLSKFIVLVPSNAIRQGTLKSLQSTAAFFAREYDNQKISIYNYSDKTVKGFIHAANHGISVMVATYQSFAGDSKLINKRGVEANLFGRARSYMEALAAIRPVLIIDEPHRFEGKQTQDYLARFDPLLTIRFGATFKNDEFRNLVHTLDSLQAFRQRLVKGITVDTVGTTVDGDLLLCLQQVRGSAKERVAQVGYQTLAGKAATVELRKKDNLGQKTGIAFLDGHVVENVTTKELLFSNGFSIALGEPASCGMLADELQSALIARSISNHFEREQALFKRGIKCLSLFFIDSVAKYLPAGGKPAVVREAFERHYREQLAEMLAREDLDPVYRSYLERTQDEIGHVHKGYFARSHSEKGEEEAIKLILQEKEKLLSFDTDLRFIFSMWALQEGWDNPNVFTLCKLAPSQSRITKLQQIGRGLRLAVNQQLERVQPDDAAFDEINDLVVVVPASEGDFVAAIQGEISARSMQQVASVFDDQVLVSNGVAPSTRVAYRVIDALAALGAVTVDETSGKATLLLAREAYQNLRPAIVTALQGIAGLDASHAQAMLAYLDAYYEGSGQIKAKQDKIQPTLMPHPGQFQKFKALWEQLNRDAVLHYELETKPLINNILARIEQAFEVRPLSLNVTRTEQVETLHQVQNTTGHYRIKPHSVFTLAGFVRELSNQTRLSLHTVAEILRRMPKPKFDQIRHNENRALALLRELSLHCIHELLIHRVSYELRETRAKTSLTDNTGQLLKTIPVALCGAETHSILNEQVRARSLYQDNFMPVDSQIERDTVDESNQQQVTVFAKLPKINIPTPVGHYNPDFAYAVEAEGMTHALYLVVETKGYDSHVEIPEKEKWKIRSATRFFDALRAQGIPVSYKTKINGEQLSQLIAEINPNISQNAP